jgi:16S rRNA (adenine1518-N6/adenine1519-N6)-dimethyltransferase
VSELLGPVQIRELAERLGIRPTKTLGQNFVHDPNTIRRIVRAAARMWCSTGVLSGLSSADRSLYLLGDGGYIPAHRALKDA